MGYGRVHDAFWDGEKIEPLSDRAALLALFLITGPHRNAIGCFRLGKGAINDLPRFEKWGIEGVSEALSEMVRTGFIVRDDRTGWTLIVNALVKDPIKGPKAAIHALGLADRVPRNTVVYQRLVEILKPQLEPHSEHLSGKPGWPITRGIEGVSKGDAIPKRSPLPLPEPIPEPEPEPKRARDARPAAKRYAFEGSVIRLKADDLERWRTNFKNLPNLEAVLTSYDAFLAKDESGGSERWYQRTAGYLAKKDAEAAQTAKAQGDQPPADIDRTRVREFRKQIDAKQEPIWRQYRSDWGPAPDEPGCRASVGILKEFGFEPVAPDFLKRASR